MSKVGRQGRGMEPLGDTPPCHTTSPQEGLLDSFYRIIQKNVVFINLKDVDSHGKLRANQQALQYFMRDVDKKYRDEWAKTDGLNHYQQIEHLNNHLLNFAQRQFQYYKEETENGYCCLLLSNEDKQLLVKLDNRYTHSYQQKIQRRMNWLCYNYNNADCVLLTLTLNPKKYRDNKLHMWMDIKKQCNRFLTGLKYHFKKTGRRFPPYLCTIEAQKNGNPHLHIVFLDAKRLLDWRQIQHLWGKGYIYINRSSENRKIRHPINYITKYITKTYCKTNSENQQTQALNWLFNIRSFSCSRGLILPIKKPSNGEWTPHYLLIVDKKIEMDFLQNHIELVVNISNRGFEKLTVVKQN